MDRNKTIEQLIAINERHATQLITHKENHNRVQYIYHTILDHPKLLQENNMLNINHRVHINNEIIKDLQQSIPSHIKKNIVSDQEIENLIADVFDNKSDPLTKSL